MDLSALWETYRGVGSEAYDPKLMFKMVLWEVIEGVLSPAQWHREVKENIAMRWLGYGIQPSRSALYAFRQRLDDVMFELHLESVRAAIAEGLACPKVGVLDGTFLRACASRHRLAKMETVQRRRAELAAVIEKDEQGEAVATEALPAWMAKTAKGRRAQADRYAAAEAELERRQAANAKRAKDKRLPEEQVRISLSDPEAPLGRDKEKVYGPLYTAELVVDADTDLIVSYEVFAQATDAGTLPTMLDTTQDVIGQPLKSMVADAGYVSVADLYACQERGVTLYAPYHENDYTQKKQAAQQGEPPITRDQFTWDAEQQTYTCPQGHQLDYVDKDKRPRCTAEPVVRLRYRCSPDHCRGCPLRGRCVKNPEKGRIVTRLEGQELIDAHCERMKTAQAKELCRKRGSVIERTYADSKAHRNFRRLSGRGLAHAKGEVGLVVFAQNLITIQRLRKAAANSSKIAA